MVQLVKQMKYTYLGLGIVLKQKDSKLSGNTGMDQQEQLNQALVEVVKLLPLHQLQI